jgi:hypothetical protein
MMLLCCSIGVRQTRAFTAATGRRIFWQQRSSCDSIASIAVENQKRTFLKSTQKSSSAGTPSTTFDDGTGPFQITTPIYYVNDKPHIGHAYTSIGTYVL